MVDLRNTACMPNIWDQEDLGACTAFAVGSAFAYTSLMERMTPFTPSPLFIYFNERTIDGDVNEDAGSTLSTGIRALRQYGVCPIDLCPYEPEKFKEKPSDKAYLEAAKHEVIGATQVAADVLAIKSALFKGFIVVLGIQVYESFESAEVAATGVVPEPNLKKEECIGGHAVALVGYDDTKKAFIMRNSWGENWGLHGYCLLPYGYISDEHLASDPWIITSVELTPASRRQ
jgi:C1A family cysteine protease